MKRISTTSTLFFSYDCLFSPIDLLIIKITQPDAFISKCANIATSKLEHIIQNKNTKLNFIYQGKERLCTTNEASRVAWVTVSIFPPNFIPLRPAHALRVTDWSAYCKTINAITVLYMICRNKNTIRAVWTSIDWIQLKPIHK